MENEKTNENKEEKTNEYVEFWKGASRIALLMMSAIYLVFVTNTVFNYLPLDGWFITFLVNAVYYGPIVICGITSVATFSKYGLVVRILLIVLWVVIFLFSFFPDVFYKIFF